jgi:hypothetical protein
VARVAYQAGRDHAPDRLDCQLIGNLATQDRERWRLERDLRDCAQGESADLASKLGGAARAFDHDVARAKALLNEVASEIAGGC